MAVYVEKTLLCYWEDSRVSWTVHFMKSTCWNTRHILLHLHWQHKKNPYPQHHFSGSSNFKENFPKKPTALTFSNRNTMQTKGQHILSNVFQVCLQSFRHPSVICHPEQIRLCFCKHKQSTSTLTGMHVSHANMIASLIILFHSLLCCEACIQHFSQRHPVWLW